MATIARPQTTTRAAQDARERNRLIRAWITRIAVYVLLTVAAFIMLFPFLYMLFTSLKTANDVFRFPPRLLPYSTLTTEYNGEDVPLFEVDVNGETRLMVIAETGIRVGYFTTADLINAEEPTESELVISLPLDEATDLDEEIIVADEDFDLYEVTVNGEAQTLLLAYRRGLARFVDPNDESVEAFGSARDTPQAEVLEFQWQNYNAVLTLRNLDRSLINTALVTVLVTLGQVTTSLLGGYAFSRMRFRGRNAVFMVYLGTIMIPFVVLIIPLYQLMVVIGWQDRLVSLILPWIFTAYGTFLMRQFFITIPRELEEAAFLDGLGRFGILWRIFVPLSGAAIATQAIITFLYAWNSFIWPLVIIGEGNTENHVITLSLMTLRNAAASEPNLVLTGAAVAILPPLVLFILAQRYFVEGIANTGLKG
ncbi:MAG: carbohydrate ABC transporter permease [Chloroflexi bacterium]|nr:carbohydrate ABC transporter permease [Chloroflexota bacterium]